MLKSISSSLLLRSLLLWSLESLLPVQESSLKEFLKGWNVFVNLPSGYRKSLIFQCLPIAADALLDKPCSSSLVVVILFLRSLMEDQVLFLNNTGVPAIAITDEEDWDIVQQVINGNYIAVYGLPESLLCTVTWGSIFSCNTFIEMLIGVAIDEAHCITQWYVSLIFPFLFNGIQICKWRFSKHCKTSLYCDSPKCIFLIHHQFGQLVYYNLGTSQNKLLMVGRKKVWNFILIGMKMYIQFSKEDCLV